jgi:hypothetical protein
MDSGRKEEESMMCFETVNALDQLNKGESLQTIANDYMLDIQQSKTEENIEGTFSYFS